MYINISSFSLKYLLAFICEFELIKLDCYPIINIKVNCDAIDIRQSEENDIKQNNCMEQRYFV